MLMQLCEADTNLVSIEESACNTTEEKIVVDTCDKMVVKELEESSAVGNECAASVVGNTLCDELLDFLANSDAHFKNQQIGDPDLTFLERRSIGHEILQRSPGQFLARFGTNIKLEHLEYFAPMKSDYEVDFYLKKLQRYHCKKLSDVDVKNRRFEALQKLISEGSYFSEEEMKSRNPLLYEQLIGQHLTKKERDERAKDYSKMTYVGYLLDRMDRDSRNELQQKQQDEEDGAIEENDTDEETSEDDDDDMERELSEKEKDVLRQEFVSSMYQSFLDGKDADFDYSSVDFNAEYDNHRDMEQDDEEKYFDSESPECIKEEYCDVAEGDDELDVYMNTLE